MKLLHISFHFEYAEDIEEILDRHEVDNFVRYPMMEGKDLDGKHFGSQVFPGNTSIVQAKITDEKVEPLLESLQAFRQAKQSHNHLETLVIPVERTL